MESKSKEVQNKKLRIKQLRIKHTVDGCFYPQFRYKLLFLKTNWKYFHYDYSNDGIDLEPVVFRNRTEALKFIQKQYPEWNDRQTKIALLFEE